MLSLQLKSGDYLTIGDDIAVQIFQQSGSAFSVAVKAPREIPILRGEVLEREGEDRPDGLRSHRPQRPSKRVRNAKNAEAFAQRKERMSAAVLEMRGILEVVGYFLYVKSVDSSNTFISSMTCLSMMFFAVSPETACAMADR